MTENADEKGAVESTHTAEKSSQITGSGSRGRQPIAVPRYYRVPGEAYGRGPILMALPSIKTLNRAQELVLKSAAIQMLGIWAYRAGGTFNPDTSKLAPGAFWAMQSTGGVLGPDVQRLDTATGQLNVGRLITDQLQNQIKSTLHDGRIDPATGTPESASQITARLRQNAETHIGAFGRLNRETMPVIASRTFEILNEFSVLPDPRRIDELLIQTEVVSPMAQAINAHRMGAIGDYLSAVDAIAGQENRTLHANVDRMVGAFEKGLQISSDFVPTPQEREAAEQALQESKVEEQAAQLADRAAPQIATSLLTEGAAA